MKITTRLHLASLTLALTCPSFGQTTYNYNPNYPLIPGDTVPRTYHWSDFRNWSPNGLPSATDEAVVSLYSELNSNFTVGYVRITDSLVAGTGTLEVLNNLEVEGQTTFFGRVIIRGTSQWGANSPAETMSALFYDNVDNHGAAVFSSTHSSPLVLAPNTSLPVWSQPVWTNHSGASLTFGTATIGGDYARITNSTGATITKTGTGDATLKAHIQTGPSVFVPAFDNHGTLTIQGGKLVVQGAGDWNGGSVTLANNANLHLNFGLPSGTVAVNGTGRLTSVGGDMPGPLTLNFAATSAVTIEEFHPYDINHDLTLNGPVTIKDAYLLGAGLVTFQGTPTFDLRNSLSGGTSPVYLYANLRNEGTTTVLGGADPKSISGDTAYTWTNTIGNNLKLVDRVALYGNTLLNNQGEAYVRQEGTGTSQIYWRFDNAGTVAVDTATLELHAARHWSGNVALAHNGTLRFHSVLPDGTSTINGTGNIELLNTAASQNLTLTYNPVSSTRTFLNNVNLAENTTLTLDGPTRLWGTVLNYGGPFGQSQTTAVELKGGVVLDQAASPNMLVNVPIRSTGLVELNGALTSRVEFNDWTNTATGYLRKTGNGLFTLAGNLVNSGTIEVEGGILQLGTVTNLTDGIAIIAGGATLKMPFVPVSPAVLTGQGSITFDNEAGPVVHTGPLTLPLSPSNQLALTNSRIIGDSDFNVSQPLDFSGNQLSFSGDIILTADTFWGPRLAQPSPANFNGLEGHVSNHADATVRGTLYAGISYYYQILDWDNLAGSTLTVGGPSGQPGANIFFSASGQLSSYGLGYGQGLLNNRSGATFVAGIGGADVYWIFSSQGTIRIINNERLTTTQAGNWNGTTVEQFQSYLNFRNTLPTGDFTVTGNGDVGFGAATTDTSGYLLDGADVPEVGTTIRFTQFDHGLYGDLSGPGRLSLYGNSITLAKLYYANGYANFAATAPTWANEGGVAIHGNLLFDGSDIPDFSYAWYLKNTTDIFGHVTISNGSARVNSPAPANSPGHGFQVKAGGELLLASSGLQYFPHSGHLGIETGGELKTTGNSYINWKFSNQGLITVTDDLLIYSNLLNWSEGTLAFTGSGNDEVRFSSTIPSGQPTFRGLGTVIFQALPVQGEPPQFAHLDNKAFSFAADTHGHPTLALNVTAFQLPDSHLRLEGTVDLIGGFAPNYPNFFESQSLELAGSVKFLPSPSSTVSLVVPQVQNEGTVTMGAGNQTVSLNGTDLGLTWTNLAGATFDLQHGTDLLWTSTGDPAGGIAPHFINEAGATFTVSQAGATPSLITWDFTNRGHIAVNSGTLVFQGYYINETGGTISFANSAILDFGPASDLDFNDLQITNLEGNGSIRFGSMSLESSTDFDFNDTVFSLSLSGDSVTFENDSTLDLGSGSLVVNSAIGGTGTIQAVNSVLEGVHTYTPVGSVITFASNVTVNTGAQFNFGTGSTVTLQDGSLTGSGSVQAGELIISGTSPLVTPGGLSPASPLVLAAESITILPGSVANFGNSAVLLDSPLSGSGVVHAGSVTWSEGTYLSVGVSVLTFNSGIFFLNGADILFGIASVITVNGQLGGTGTIEAGTFIHEGGPVTPGSSPGTLAMVGNATFSAASAFTFELGAAAQDHITVDGSLTLDGTVNVVLLGGFIPGPGASFNLFSATTLNTSAFNPATDFVLPALPTPLTWDTSTFATTGTISVVVTGGPFQQWRASAFTPAQLANLAISGDTADPDGDGLSNTLEYALGASPLAADSASRIPAATVSATNQLVLTYRRPGGGVAGVVYSVEKTASLGSGWSAAGLGADYTQSLTPNVNGTETVEITSTASVSQGAPPLFLRIFVTAP